MKKILLAVIIVILIFLTYTCISKGLAFGILKVDSIIAIKDKSQNLDNDLQEATRLTAQEYPQAKSTLDTSINKLKTNKEQYENRISNISDEEALKYKQIDTYEKEFLWTTIGTYATKEKLSLGMDIVDSGNNYYNLEFSVVGSYSGVADFIYDIENNDELGFKIEEFSVEPYSVTETTSYKDGAGRTYYTESDYAYPTTIETQFSDKQGQTKSTNSNNAKVNVSKNTDDTNTVSNTLASTNTNSNTSNTSNTNKTTNGTSVVNDPDRVTATFVVKNVSISLN